ncbi:tetratricopeptide repeat protein [Telmatobacter sp. DSM 110680]|uniref:Tetratricopeptide repeat protein n=1 Tax=Telmatobacter sp. DSM 110680 TaxID=3036704 RepID=A0AAU7DLP1_9BACT
MGQQNPATTRSQAMTLEQQGQNEDAEHIWSEIVKADPSNAEALAHLGLLAARQEHYDAAIDFYRRALAINPNLLGLQMNMGLASFKAAQFPDAIKFFSAEIRKHPGDPRLTILLGMAHYGMKDYLVAIPYLQRAAKRDPQNVTLRMTLARSCLQSRQFQSLLDTHKEIKELNADSAEADMLAGEALAEMGDRAAAEQEFREAILKDPRMPQLHFGLGYLLWSESKWSESAAQFESELQINPKFINAQIYLADSWVRQNEFAKALAVLSPLIPSARSEALFHRDLGIIYANSGRAADAIREFATSIEADPEDPEPHIQLAKLYQTTNQRSAVDGELQKAKGLASRSNPSLEEVLSSTETPVP